MDKSLQTLILTIALEVYTGIVGLVSVHLMLSPETNNFKTINVPVTMFALGGIFIFAILMTIAAVSVTLEEVEKEEKKQ